MSSGSENEDAGFQLMNAKSTERAKQRAEIAQTQKRLIDELVEMRVKMQPLLVLANRLPQVGFIRALLIYRGNSATPSWNAMIVSKQNRTVFQRVMLLVQIDM